MFVSPLRITQYEKVNRNVMIKSLPLICCLVEGLLTAKFCFGFCWAFDHHLLSICLNFSNIRPSEYPVWMILYRLQISSLENCDFHDFLKKNFCSFEQPLNSLTIIIRAKWIYNQTIWIQCRYLFRPVSSVLWYSFVQNIILHENSDRSIVHNENTDFP